MEWFQYGLIIIGGLILANIAHDLGHYYMAKQQKARGIFLEIGRGKELFKRDGIAVHVNLFKTGRILFKKFPSHEEWKKLPIFTGGILGTAILSMILGILSWIIPWTIGRFNGLKLLSYVMQIHIVYSLVPHQLFGKMSDGKRVYSMYQELKTKFNFNFRR